MKLQIEEYLRPFTAAAIGAFATNRLAALPPSREATLRRRALQKITLAVGLIVSGPIVSGSIASASVPAAILPERIAKAAQDHVDAGEYPALVIAYVDGDKSEIDAFGKLDNGNKPDANTVFEIGSITKTFTATLLALDVQSGKLEIDQPVAALLPGFKVPSRNGKPITLLDLADQHSGLPRLPSNLPPAAANPYAAYDGAKLRDFLANYELTRDPGETFEYSNLGVGLLGFALAQNAKKSYGAVVDEKIFGPLQMRSSGTTSNDAMRAHLASGHDVQGKPALNWDFDAFAGAGAIRSSGADMLRYLEANMGRRGDALASAMKFAQAPRRDVSHDMRIGLSWMTRSQRTSSVVWHNGGTAGYCSFLGFTSDGKRGVVILTNIATSVDELGFATLLADAPIPPAHKTIKLDATALDAYVGTYQLAAHFLLDVTRNGDQLSAQATGQAAFSLFASAPDEFFVKGPPISVSFKRDAQGKVTSLVLHQNGDHPAPKIDALAVAAATGSIALDDAALQTYVGKYQLAPGAIFDVTTRDHRLYVQLSGQAAYPVSASAKDKFFYSVVDAQLAFERDAKGAVIAVTLHQNGIDQRAPRISP